MSVTKLRTINETYACNVMASPQPSTIVHTIFDYFISYKNFNFLPILSVKSFEIFNMVCTAPIWCCTDINH